MSLLVFCLHSAVFTIVCLVFSPNRISPPTSLALRECVCLLTFGLRATASLLLNIYSSQSGIEAQNSVWIYCLWRLYLTFWKIITLAFIHYIFLLLSRRPLERAGVVTPIREEEYYQNKNYKFIYLTTGGGGHKETNCCNRRLLPISGWWMCNICSQEDNWLLKHWWSVDRDTLGKKDQKHWSSYITIHKVSCHHNP